MPPVRVDIDGALSRVASSLTPLLRSRAKAHGWPSGIVAALSVSNQGGRLTADVPERLRPALLDLEFGVPGQSPRPAVGNFFHSHETQRMLQERATQVSGFDTAVDRLFS